MRVFGQTFDATGNRIGAEFRINQRTRFHQEAPSIDVSADGRFAVSWQSYHQDGSVNSVIARIYNADGTAATDEFLVNQTTRGIQGNADISFLTNGNLVVTWHGRGSGDRFGVFVRVFSSNGTALTDEFGVSEFTKGLQYDPTVAGDSTGGFWIAWSGHGSDDLTGIYARRFGADGAALGGQFRVNQHTKHSQNRAAIATSDDGRVLIGWQSQLQDGSALGVYARLYNADGSARGNEFRVNETTKRLQYRPHLDFTSDGGFAVTWMGRGTGDRWGVFLREYNANGIAETSERLVNVTTKGLQFRPSIAGTTSGYVVMWSGRGQGDRRGVFASVYQEQPATEFDLLPIPNQIIDEGQMLTVAPSLLAGSSTANTFAVVGILPDGATLDTSTGRIEWTPVESQGPDSYSVTVTASGSHGQSDSETFTITVNEVNLPPVLDTIADRTVTENTAILFTATASDPDIPLNTLTFTLTGTVPVGATIDPTSGQFNWTPDSTQGPGTYPIMVQVSDGVGGTDQKTFTVTVNEDSLAPSLSPIGNRVIDEQTLLTFTATVTDANQSADTLTFTLENAPSAASIDPATGVFTWTPTEADGPGSFTATVVVTDNTDRIDSETFTITVNEVNLPPVLAVIGNQSVVAGESLTFTATGTDVDIPENTLIYAISGDVPAAATLDANTGVFTWNSLATDTPGELTVTVSVNDQQGGIDFETLTITVQPPANPLITLVEGDRFATELNRTLILPNETSAIRVTFQAPEFDTTAQQSIRDAFEIEVTDTAGNPLSFPYASGRDAVYNWSEDLEPVFGAGTSTTAAAVGQDHEATVNLSGLAAGTQVSVTVRLVNNDGDRNSSVIIRGIEVVEATEAAPVGVSGGRARSPGVAVLNFSRLSDISGSFTAEYGRTTLTGDNNELITELVVTNRGNQAVTGQIIVAIDNISELDAFAMHPDGFTPDGSAYFDLTAEMNGQPLAPGESLRSREIAFLNNSGQRFTYKLRTFGALNAAPTGLSTHPLTSIEAGKTYRYIAQATDPDGQALSYSVVTGPAALQIDAQTGKLTWETSVADIGSHRVTLRATDPHGLYVEQSFSIDVVELLQNRPPNFVTDPVTDAIASSGFEITTVATGAGPAGVSVISGFRGSRLVSINGGDQTLSVLAGQNNDRFDDATQYFSGEPRPTNSLFDVGYSVDIGLPAWTEFYDGRFLGNDVAGMDHADLNGDGFLDLVALTTFMASGVPQTMQITRMLNDGNGNFGTPQVIGSLRNPDQVKNLVIADINGDGHQDVLALQRRTSKIFTLPGNGNGTFQSMVTTTLDVNFEDFRVVDLNQDGKMDLVGRRGHVGFGVVYDQVWKPGVGDGTFLPVQEIKALGSLPNAYTDLNARPYAVVDVDGDGDLDIVTSNIANGNIDVLLNDGNQQFTLGVSIDPPGGNFAPYSVHVADFTGDGKLDIAANNSWTPKVDLFVGDGSGIGFTHRDGGVIYGSSGNWAGSDEPRDIDGDGDLDLVLTALGGDPLSPQVLINDGSGFFARYDYPMIDFPGQVAEGNQVSGDVARSAMFGDYNADGVIDLAYATAGVDFNGLGIRLGTRPGEFGSTRTTPLPGGGTGSEVHAGDFNGDGIQDLLALPSNLILLGDGQGGFPASFPAYQVFRATASGSIADFNQDGLPDVVATASGSRYYVALANGDGTFTVSDDQFVGAGYSATRIGDFNNDGLPDFIAKAGGERHIDVHLNLASQPGTFERSFRTTISGQGVNVSGFDQAFAVGDFNRDGNLDFVAGDQVSGEPLKLVTYAGDGAGNFSVIAEAFAYDDALFGGFYYPGQFGAGDLNGDGVDDVVSFTYAGPRIHLANGDGTFTTTDLYPVDPILQRGLDSYVIDFNEDGWLDLVQLTPNSIGGGGSGTLSVRLGRGDGTFDDSLRVGLQGGASPATFADMDNDGHLDLAYAVSGAGNYGPPDLVTYYGIRRGLIDVLAVDLNGDGNEEVLAINENNDRLKLFVGDNLGKLTRQPDLFTGRAPQAVAAADLDGDGALELLTANRAGRSISVFTGDIKNGWTAVEYSVGKAPIDVAAADLNGDGFTDVVVLDEGEQALWVYLGDGTHTLGTPVAIALGDAPGRFVLKDATGDGIIDAVVTLVDTNRLMIISGIGNQPSAPPIYVALADSPSDVAVVDLNDDGNPDLAATLPGANVLSILYGRGNLQFARAQQIAVGQAPTRVTLADVDKDGRIDLVVNNTGDNTASVIYNRFDPNEVYRYDADAVDPDDDSLTYAIVDGPGGLIINSQTGALLWAASPDQVGVHDVTISADDGRGGIATQTFKIDVITARENAAPLIASQPVTRMGAGETFTYRATALDNDRDALRYRLLDAPSGATIDPTTGLVQWDGRSDMAMDFSLGGNFGNIVVPAHASLKPESITVEGWYKLNSLPRFQVLIQDTGRNGVAYQVLTFETNQSLRVIFQFDNSADTFQFFAPVSPVTDRWYHLALTYDATTGTGTLYVDGQAVGSGTTPNPQPLAFSPTAETTIGDRGGSPTQAIIDNYRIWNVARSAAEIQEGMGRQYENDPRLVLDYRFDRPNTRNVRDFSLAKNDGLRVGNPLEPQLTTGLADPGVHAFTISVEDGRGGFDTQTFDVEIVPELRGSIAGHLFDDLDADGTQDDGSENPAEPSLAGWQLYIDTNGNAYPDPNEPQTVTNASGNYRFDGLLPGDYPVRVSPVAGYDVPNDATHVTVTASAETAFDLAIEQLSLSHIRGQLKTEDGEAIAYWMAYADLDDDGMRDEDELMAMSDRNGDYALTGLAAGTYKIRAELPAGWVDTAGRDGLTVALAADAISRANDFVLKPANTSVTGGVRFVTMPSTGTEARQTFRYHTIAMRIGAEALRYDLSLAPTGMTVDPNTGLTVWRPTIDQVGEHLVILRATSVSGSIALHDFYLSVTAPNTPPVILAPPASTTAYVGFSCVYDIIAQDAESTTLIYSLTQAPAGASIDAAIGRLTWLPAASTVGSQDFTVAVTDEAGATTEATWTVDVQSAAPGVLPLNVTLPRKSAAVTRDYVSRIRGTDAIGRPLTWTLVSGPAGMTVDADGAIRWTPAANQLGTQAIELNGATPEGNSQAVNFSIEVTGRLLNAVPTIDSQPTTSIALGQTFTYDVRVSDTDRDIFSFALLDAPVGMSVHPSLGTIRWTPAADQLGESKVVVQVSDPSGDTATQEFQLKVSRFGGPPIITSVPPTEAHVGSAFLYSVAAVDREGDPLAYTLLAAPIGMTIVETTGELSWTPTADQLGQRDVVIQVSDGIGGAATQAFVIRVSAGAPNLPPVITTSSPRFGAVGTAFSYPFAATDPENTTITYRLGRGPVGMTVDATSGQVTWTPTAAQAGKHVVTLIATDAGGASAIESFEFDVLAQNTSPVINSNAPANVAAGAIFMYDVLASDADLDQLTFELTQAPTGAQVDSFGRIRWQTSVALIGSHDFEVKVRDPRGGQAMQSFTLDVIEDLVPPKVSIIENLGDGSRNILPWDGPFTVYVRAIDNVAIASLTLTANGMDIPLDSAGTAKFTFEEWKFARINATATAIDTNGNVTSKTITFDYDFPEGWSGAGTEDIPTAAITSPGDTESVTGMVSIVGTAAHADLFGYKLSYRHVDETSFTEFFESTTPVTGGELGVWDTSLLLNDEYVIRLEVATNAGVVNVVEHHVGLAGELKLGNFRLAFTDMVIPVAGIPIEITRIYDTLQADREGDFGYGWRLEFRDTDLRVGLPKSGLEDIGIFPALRSGVKVYLNVPGLGRQGFTFNPDIRVLPGFGGNNLVLARPRFTADPGVTATLSTGTSSYLQVNEYGELYAPGGIPYNPASPNFGGAYVLTTNEGITYRIDGANGKLNSATDRNGNTLTFSESGVDYENGVSSLSFVRDAQGRITGVTDPDGNSVKYQYSSSGDLVSVIDRELNETKFMYAADTAHYLEDLIDPLGRTGAKTAYDEQGRLIRIVDAQGIAITLASDPNNLVESITNAEGNKFTVEYDVRGNIVSQVDARGSITRRTYDSSDSLTSETDPLGHTTLYTYDSSGNLTSITDALGHRRTYVYGTHGAIVSEVDEIGGAIQNSLDSKGNVLTSTDPAGNVITYTYDARGNQINETDAMGYVTQYAYDAAGNLVAWTDALGHTTNYTFDGRGNRLSESSNMTTSGGVVAVSTAWTYDANSRVTSSTNALGNISRTEYNPLGLKTATIDENGNRTEYSYDERGQRISTLFADGTSISTSYNEIGRQISSTDQLGRVTRFEYDAVGNSIATIYPDTTPTELADNPRTTREYDLAGQMVAQIDELGNRSEFLHDASGRTIALILPDNTPENPNDNLRTEYVFDARGLLTATIDPANGRQTHSYDQVGNLVATSFSDGTTVQQVFDSLHRRIAEIDQNGVATQYEFDEIDRLTAVVQTLNVPNATGLRTVYGYDEHDNFTTQTDANGNTTLYQNDVLSRRVGTTLPLGQQSTTVYDAAGNVLSETNFNGQEIEYTYDALNRLTDRELPDGSSFVFTYTATGMQESIVDDRGTTRYTYDARDRVLSRIEPDGIAIAYGYDVAGNEVSQTTPAGTVTKAYDELRRLTTVTDTLGGVTTYGYDDRGRLVETRYPNGVSDLLTLDDLSRILRIETQGTAVILRSMDYTLDATGRRISIVEASGRTVVYEYDALYRLVVESITDAALGNRTIEYSYDLVGNRVMKLDSVEGTTIYSYDANDRLLEETTAGVKTMYTYDANGNTLTKFIDANNQATYRWNAENRLMSATIVNALGTIEMSFKYDADGLRVESTTDGETERSLLDKNRQYAEVVVEYLPGGEIQAAYTRGHQLISATRGDEQAFYHADAIGTVRIMTDADGSIVNAYVYDAFGNTLEQSIAFENSFLFAGEFRDANLNWDFLRARYYNATSGRFPTRDSFDGIQSLPLTIHKYVYTHNDPANNTDPSGEITYQETLGAITIIANVASLFFTLIGRPKEAKVFFVIGSVAGVGFAVNAVRTSLIAAGTAVIANEGTVVNVLYQTAIYSVRNGTTRWLAARTFALELAKQPKITQRFAILVLKRLIKNPKIGGGLGLVDEQLLDFIKIWVLR